MLLAIDPGTTESAYVDRGYFKIIEYNYVRNGSIEIGLKTEQCSVTAFG